MMYAVLALLLLRGAWSVSCLESVQANSADNSGVDTTPSASSTLGALYRQARSDQYYTSRYAGDSLSVSSGTIGARSDTAEPRDAAYFESRCITCDPNKSTASSVHDRGYRVRPRYDWYDDDLEDRRYPMSYRDRYEDYDRLRSPAFDYDQRYNRFGRYDLRPLYYYSDRYDNRYDRDRPTYDRNYDRIYYERGNGYDNLDSRYPYESRGGVGGGGGGDRYSTVNRRPAIYDDPYSPRYEHRNRYPTRYEGVYDRYDPYDRYYTRKPMDDRYYDRFGSRGSGVSIGYGNDVRGVNSGVGIGGGYASSSTSGNWGPGYDRGYASAWSYGGNRDNWRDRDFNRDRDYGNRDRDPGYYRPRDYFYDSTAAPGGSRGTSYLHDRPESSTASNGISQESVTNSPKSQETNKVYKD